MAHPVDRAVSAALRPYDRVGVACSGGPDSIALAAAAIKCAQVTTITIDHGLHPDSARVAAEVAAWARAAGATAIVERVVVARRASLEAAARDARYAVLERIDLPVILLGHTARDQAETVVMRVLRGTGPAGLAGIPARRGKFLRPLLALDRAAIDDYVTANQLPTWLDPMNADLAITRVRVRDELLPLLRRENPQLDAALVRLAAHATEWLAVLDDLARPFARLPIDCAALAGQPAAVRKHAVSRALQTRGLLVDAVHLDAIDRLVTAPARGSRPIAIAGATLVRTYDRLDVEGAATEPASLAIPPGYELRRWRAGDRMRPPRLRGRSRKLSDLYIDAKVPRAQRSTARVLVRVRDREIVRADHIGFARLLDDERDLLAAIHAPPPT